METGNNISLSLRLVDSQYHLLNKSDCDLSIFISRQQVAYSALDKVHNKIVSLVSFKLPEDEANDSIDDQLALLVDEQILDLSFNKVRIAFDFGESTLIPNDLFKPNELNAYFDFTATNKHENIFLSDYISQVSAHNVYGIPGEIVEKLKVIFGKPKLYHFSSALLQNAIKENRNNPGKQLFVHSLTEKMWITAIADGKLKFFNRFNVKTKEDFSYYLLAVCEELHLNPEVIKIYLSGTIDEKNSTFYAIAANYFKHLYFSERPKIFKYAAKLDDIPPHYYNHVFSIHVCE